jgi:hypothetical protein
MGIRSGKLIKKGSGACPRIKFLVYGRILVDISGGKELAV